jgi:hypothetical protein
VILGLSSSAILHWIGDIPIAEILALLGVPILLVTKGRNVLRTQVSTIYLFMSLWLFGQVITDIYRATEWIDWIRADASIVFLALDVALFLMLVLGDRTRQLMFLGAYGVGAIMQARFYPNEFAIDAPWKFGYAPGINLLTVMLCGLLFELKLKVLGHSMLIAIIAINMYCNFRSAVLILLITAALSTPVVPEKIGPWTVLPPSGSWQRLLVILLLSVTACAASFALIQAVSSSGLLDEEAQRKNELQGRVRGGILIGGRPEFLVSSQAVMDSPLIGHGSWAQDQKYVEMLADLMVEDGVQSDDEAALYSASALIPAHSHIMGAWVWAGFLGALFWIFILIKLIQAATFIGTECPPWAQVPMYLFVTMAWDFLFSPFGSTRRIVTAFGITLIVETLIRRERWKAVMRYRRFVTTRNSRASFARLSARRHRQDRGSVFDV